LLNLPLAEQCVWHELIDENQLTILPGRPVFTPPLLTVPYRKLEKDIIGVCGTLAVHIAAAKGKGRDILKSWPHQINSGDYFNNRPLHFAALRFRGSDHIIEMLKGGGDAALVNTSGETFVHILFGRLPLEYLLSNNLYLVKYLVAANFDFSCRDYHGRTPLHTLLQEKMNLREGDLAMLKEVFQLLRPDLDCVDNFGFSIRSYLLKKTREDIPKTRINEFLPALQTTQHNIVDFRHLLKEASDNWETYIKDILVHPHHISCFDKNGDTALIALIKWWNYDFDELLLEDAIRHMVAEGAEVHMRNRVGDTALAIATRRGLRPAVTTLVDLGASIHTRNYQKIGILRQAQNSLAQAKHVEADKLYGMILSCIVFLVDLGATIDTHAYREWGASCVPLKDLDKAYSLYRQVRPAPVTLNRCPPLEKDWLP
jgi:ankyrin repeat protein